MGHYTELVQKARELLKDKNIKFRARPPFRSPAERRGRSESPREGPEEVRRQFHRPEGELMLQMIAAQTALARMGRDHDLTLRHACWSVR